MNCRNFQLMFFFVTCEDWGRQPFRPHEALCRTLAKNALLGGDDKQTLYEEHNIEGTAYRYFVFIILNVWCYQVRILLACCLVWPPAAEVTNRGWVQHSQHKFITRFWKDLRNLMSMIKFLGPCESWWRQQHGRNRGWAGVDPYRQIGELLRT